MSSLLQRLNNRFETKGFQPEGTLTVNQRPMPVMLDDSKWIGNEARFYPSKDGEIYISHGYNINAVVHTCITLIQKMFGKVPFYVVNVKKEEQKTYREYQTLIKSIHDRVAIAEAKRMKKKSIDGIIIDTRLSEFINKPNRNQSGTTYREMLIGYKKLTGEGNQWYNRGVDPSTKQLATDKAPLEMFSIPKFLLNLVGNGIDPWEIIRYEFLFGGGQTLPIPKENLSMWNESNFSFASQTLEHLRGQPPLEAALLNIQALNEGAIREIKEAVNGGANGLLFRKDAKELPKDPGTIAFIRQQVNNAVNGQDVAGAIAWLAGEWGYLPFGKTSQELQRAELTVANIDRICNVLGVPPGMLKSDQTYANAPYYNKQLVYNVIAPEAYSLRDLWNSQLLPLFGMDQERFAIDCDVLALPELAQDLKEQVTAVKDANWLTLDEKRIATGYEPLDTPESQKIYLNQGLTTLEDLNLPIGSDLSDDVNLLEE